MGFSYNVNVLNQKGSPALYTDTFANRPNFGYAGRLFIANDTSAIYEDTGTAWVLIANVSSGAGTLQQVTTNGNTSNVGISITAGGLSTNSLTDTALTLGSVLFAGAAGLVTQDNAAFFWDDTNNRLGLNTTTPGNTLDVHFAGTASTIGINNTAGNAATIVFANTGANKWRIGNSSSNTFDLINVGLASNALSISSADNRVDIDGNTFFQKSLALKTGSGNVSAAGYTLIHSVSGTGLEGIQLSLSPGGFASLLFNSSNNRQFTFPNADGTVSLTSDLSAYLPLTGGTLSGRLNGVVGGILYNTAGLWLQGSNSTDGIAIGGTGGSKKTIDTYGGALALNGTAGNAVLINSLVDDTVNKLQVTGSATVSTQLAVGTNTFSYTGATRGNITIGGSASSLLAYQVGGVACAYIYHDGTDNYWANNKTGKISVTATSNGVFLASGGSSWSPIVSDERLKKDFETTQGLNEVLQLEPVKFRYLEENENTAKRLGFKAQNIQPLIPEMVMPNGKKDIDGSDFLTITPDYLLPVLVKAIQDQQKIIESLIKRIELLENK